MSIANEVQQYEPQQHLSENISDCINEYGLNNVILHPIGLVDRALN